MTLRAPGGSRSWRRPGSDVPLEDERRHAVARLLSEHECALDEATALADWTLAHLARDAAAAEERRLSAQLASLTPEDAKLAGLPIERMADDLRRALSNAYLDWAHWDGEAKAASDVLRRTAPHLTWAEHRRRRDAREAPATPAPVPQPASTHEGRGPRAALRGLE